jgi:hypothetical protein
LTAGRRALAYVCRAWTWLPGGATIWEASLPRRMAGGRAKASSGRRPKVRRDERVLLNVTGADRLDSEPPGNVHWFRRTGDGWQPEDAHDKMGHPLWEGSP